MSDILIKGMEMPENCEKCPMFAIGTGCFHCKADDRWEDFGKSAFYDAMARLYEDCPLVRVMELPISSEGQPNKIYVEVKNG